MAGRVQGITIEIGGDTTKLSQAITNAKNNTRSLQNELKSVDAALKFDPKNVELVTQKQKLLSDAVEKTRERLNAYKKAKDDADKAIADGVNVSETQYRRLQREIVFTENELKRLEEQAESTSGKLKISAESVGKAGDKLTNIGTSLLPVTAAIAGLSALSISAASDYEESLNKIDVAFKENSEMMKTWANDSLESYGIAKGTALEMAALYGDMASGMGITIDQSTEMSQALVGLAGDLASFKNVSVEVAQNALKGIFTGEGESLKSLGVIMTDATLSQYALAEGIKVKYSEMDQASKVMLRYQYVMDSTKNAQGDFANTSDGAANSMRILQESVNELSVAFGQELLPLITPVIQDITEVVNKFAELDEETKEFIVSAALTTAAIGPLLIAIGNMVKGASALASGFAVAKTGVTALWGVMSAHPVGALVTVVAALTAGLVAYNRATDTAAIATRKLIEESESLRNETNDLISSTQDLKAENESLSTSVNDMIDELYDLQDKENLSNEEKDRMLSLVAQLNSIIPDLNLALDSETGRLNIQKQSVSDLANEYIRLAKSKALAQQLEGYVSSQMDLEAQKKKIDDEVSVKKGQQEAITGFSFKRLGLQVQIDDLTYESEQIDKQLKAVNKQIEETSKALAEIGDVGGSGNGGQQNTGGGFEYKSAGGGGSSKSSSKSKADQERKERVQAYSDEIAEFERLAERKYNTLKGFDELSEEDEIQWYKDSAERYREYSADVENQTYMSEEEQYKLIRQYTEKAEDLELEAYNKSKELIEKKKTEITEQLNSIADEYAKSISEIESAKETFAQALADVDLYTTTTATYRGMGRGRIIKNGAIYDEKDAVISNTKLANLSEQIAKLDKYSSMLDSIKARGVSQEFYEEVRSQGLEGASFLETLLNASDEEFNTFINQWQELQDKSLKVAEDAYRTDGEIAGEKFAEGIRSTMDNLPDEFKEYAREAMDAFIKGLEEKKLDLNNVMQNLTSSFEGGYASAVPVISGGGSSSVTNNRNTEVNINIDNNGSVASPAEVAEQNRRTIDQLADSGVL